MITPAKIFSCTQSKSLSELISKSYGQKLGNIALSKYSDGEFQPSFEESIRGSRIFIIGSTHPSSENLMQLLLMLDAAKRSSARHITAVIPYFGWARQDRKDKPRVPIGAKLIAKLIEAAGATRIITMDLHADQIQGFFEKPVDHLYASSIFIPYVESLKLNNLKNCKEVFITNSLFGIRPVEKIEKFNFNIGQDTYDIDKFLSNLGM